MRSFGKTLLSLALLCSTCCAPAVGSKPPAPILVLPQAPTLAPPPAWAPVTATLGSTTENPTDCPPQFAACLSADEAASLVTQLGRLGQWAGEAWDLCGTVSK